MNNLLKELYKANIQETTAIRELAINYNQTNSQDFIEWQDKLNDLSLQP